MDASTLFKPALAARGLALAALLLAPAAAHAGPITYRAGFFSGSIPQTWEFNETNPNGSFTLAGYAASAGGLSGFVNVRRDQFTPHPKPVAEIIIDDVIIQWTGAGPAPTSTTVRLGMRLAGGFTGDIQNGSGSATVGLDLSGQGVTSVGGGISLPQTFFFPSSEYVGGVDATIVISRLAPIGVPLTVKAQLSVAALNVS